MGFYALHWRGAASCHVYYHRETLTTVFTIIHLAYEDRPETTLSGVIPWFSLESVQSVLQLEQSLQEIITVCTQFSFTSLQRPAADPSLS